MRNTYLITIVCLLLMQACGKKADKEQIKKEVKKEAKTEEKVIGKPKLDFSAGRMTPEILWGIGRVNGLSLNSKTGQILFGVKYYDIKENKGNNDLYVMKSDGSEKKQITHSPKSEIQAQWTADGTKISFLSAESGSMQLWEMQADGSNRTQISEIEGGINGYVYSPDMSKILYIKKVKLMQSPKDKYPDLPKANARIYEDLMMRHWGEWDDYAFSHIFTADYKNGKLSNHKDIMKDEIYDSPLEPFGGMEQIQWSADSKKIAYTCKKKFGKEYAVSTNSGIYIYNTEDGTTYCMTEDNKGYDTEPSFSPDGKYIAWLSMERDGFEADKNRLFIMDIKTKEKTELSEGWDSSASTLHWSEDSKRIYFISGVQATYQIHYVDLESKKITQITKGVHNFNSVAVAKDKLIATKQSMMRPTEIYAVTFEGEEQKISDINDEIYKNIAPGKVEKRMVKTTDGKDMLVWIILPPNFDPQKKYPALLYCQGGPQSALSQFFSFRWNFQIMAANDYIVVAPNRRGLPSFGQEWNDQISCDYGGQNMKDYFSAIDEISKEPYIDENKLAAVGASYGGFSVYWLAGNHNKRFKTFIAHCGIFNFESMYGSTEELFFVNWDLGGPYWNKKMKNSYGASPHLFVKNWDTPILVIHGEKDFRIPYTQAINAFTVAKMKGIESRFLSFPEENHWVLSPQNGILWQREFFEWLDKYLK